jgi:hypothetical protein
MPRAAVAGRISLLVMGDQVCPWLGGTGGFKLGLKYPLGLAAQRSAWRPRWDINSYCECLARQSCCLIYISSTFSDSRRCSWHATFAQHPGILPCSSLCYPLPTSPSLHGADSKAISLLKMSDQVGAHLAGRHGRFQSWISSNDHPASLHTTAAFLYIVPHCTLPSPLFSIPATLGLVASPLGAVISPAVTWILIDSLISHCTPSPDWRPHAPTAVQSAPCISEGSIDGIDGNKVLVYGDS